MVQTIRPDRSFSLIVTDSPLGTHLCLAPIAMVGMSQLYGTHFPSRYSR